MKFLDQNLKDLYPNRESCGGAWEDSAHWSYQYELKSEKMCASEQFFVNIFFSTNARETTETVLRNT